MILPSFRIFIFPRNVCCSLHNFKHDGTGTCNINSSVIGADKAQYVNLFAVLHIVLLLRLKW